MSDPMGFFTDDFSNIETSEGLATDDLLPEQWAVLHLEEVDYALSKEKQTPGLVIRARCDEKLAKTPKRSFFHRLYLTERMQKQLDGFTRAAGGFAMSKRFGAKANDADTREQIGIDEKESWGKALAAKLKGSRIVAKVNVESGGNFPDKNRIASYYEASDRNMTALLEGDFDVKRITVREEKLPNGKAKRYVAVKQKGQPTSASAPGTIE